MDNNQKVTMHWKSCHLPMR